VRYTAAGLEAVKWQPHCAALVTQPGDILITDNLRREYRTDLNKTKMGKYKSVKITITTWNIRGLTHKDFELSYEWNQMQVDNV
jgi:hypothetical protein